MGARRANPKLGALILGQDIGQTPNLVLVWERELRYINGKESYGTSLYWYGKESYDTQAVQWQCKIS